jgi:hypothetical protein
MMRWKFETIDEQLDRLSMPIPECGCHMWLGTLNGDGYPRLMHHSPRNVVRIVYRRQKGEIPEGFQVDHLCKARWCINPDHLEAVTPAVNQQRRSFSKFCKKGHLRVEIASGRQRCLECRRETQLNYYHRRREERLIYSRDYDLTKRKHRRGRL